MNERIRQLIKTKSTILFPGTDTVDCEITDIEKFAELIVEECAKLVSQETSLPYDSYSEKIRKYFGVNYAR